MQYQIIPSILTDSVVDFKQKLTTLQELPVERVSLDVIDGIYADNLTVGLDDIWPFDFGELAIDVQLLVEEPVDYLGQVSGLQAKSKRVIGHIEKMGNQQEFLALAKDLGMAVGWGLDVYTPIESIGVEELLRADCLLLMSVPAGFSGQPFKEVVLAKIKELRDRGFSQDVIVDGGMNLETIVLCREAGANQFAVTSFLWEAEDVGARFEELKNVLR